MDVVKYVAYLSSNLLTILVYLVDPIGFSLL